MDGPQPPAGSFLARYEAGEFDDLYGLPAGRIDAALARPLAPSGDALADALASQAAARGDAEEQRARIERLRHPAARVVVTGQQAGLLLGPTYTLSKAITALRLAERFDRDDRPVVPVFWVASQDHDVAEIDHAFLLDRSERLHRIEVPLPADRPSGRIPLPAGSFDRLADALRGLDVPPGHLPPALELLEDAWTRADSVADLFARLLSSLLGRDGLVVLDPMRPEIARLFRPVLEAELRDPRAGPDAIRSAGEALRAWGERPQLGRGEDATNLFLQEGGDARRALRVAGRTFHPDGQGDRRLRRDDLLALLDDDPAAITPAAGLRPVVQDSVLPTAAIVVGPGELRYFAQLRGVYDHHAVPMPVVWPRASVTVVEPPVARILARHGLSVAEYLDDPDGVARATVLRLHGHADRFRDGLARLDDDVSGLLAEVDALDPTLTGAVERGREVLAATLARLREKSADALLRRDDETRRQFERLSSHLTPNGDRQERVLSPFSFFLKFGIEPVLARLRSLAPEGEQVLTIDPPAQSDAPQPLRP